LIIFFFFVFLELGKSGCKYLGGIDPDDERCHERAVRLETLPVECSFLLYDGIKIDDNFLISPTYFPTDIGKKMITNINTHLYVYNIVIITIIK
jgi:hypothetical protein